MPHAGFRWALGYVTPYWRRLILVVALSLVGTGLSLIIPYLSKVLVDVALLGRSPSALFRIVVWYAAITLLTFLINMIAGLRYTRVSAEILFDMRLALFRHLQQLSPRFYARMPLGQIVSRLNADVSEIQRVVSEAALSWIGNVLFLAGTVVMLAVLDLRLLVVSLVTMPPALFVLIRYRRSLEASIAVVRSRSADIGAFLIETLRGMRLVVGSNAQAREVARFARRNDSFIEGLMVMRRMTYLAGGVPGLLVAGSTAVVFLYGGSRVIDGAMTLGTLVAFLAYQARLLGPVQGLMGLYTNVATARVSLARLREVFDEPVDVVDDPDASPLESARGEVTLDAVSVSHGRGAVLRNVSFRIAPGEVVGLAGRSGVGKSTVVALLLRHLDPDQGIVRLDGRDVRHVRLADVRRHVVAVEQETFLFHATMAENVRYVKPDASDAEVAAAIDAAALRPLVDTLPDGIETVVGENGHALSAGERQRVALARVHLINPAVLILDEATSALDATSQSAVMRGFEAAMATRTTIIVSHRVELLQRANRVLVLDDARLAADDTPARLVAPGGMLHAIAHPR